MVHGLINVVQGLLTLFCTCHSLVGTLQATPLVDMVRVEGGFVVVRLRILKEEAELVEGKECSRHDGRMLVLYTVVRCRLIRLHRI